LPGLGLASSVISACRAPRGPQHISSDDFVLTISLTGGRIVHQRDREAAVGEGEAMFTTSADPGVVTMAAACRNISLRIPSSILRPTIADLDACLLRAIPRNSPALLLLTGYVGAIQNDDVLMRPVLRDLAVVHIHDLVSLALGASRDAAEIAHGRGVPAARLRAIKSEIMENLGSGNLSIGVVAAWHGITPRYVHMLFESEGTTFSAFVLGHRLARAYRMLGDVRNLTRTIGTIAFECGFNDLSWFNRSFRRHYGATPSDIREAAQRQMRD
jgi:AraC-like DNA-binding protein